MFNITHYLCIVFIEHRLFNPSKKSFMDTTNVTSMLESICGVAEKYGAPFALSRFYFYVGRLLASNALTERAAEVACNRAEAIVSCCVNNRQL